MKQSSSMKGVIRFALAVGLALGCAGQSFAQSSDNMLLTHKTLSYASGKQVYRHICQGCHMPDARGAKGAGTYPALAGNPRLASAHYMAAVMVHGRNDMPSFSRRSDLKGFEALAHVTLTDVQIAAVVNYVRSHFGNHYRDTLSAADVKAMHP